MSLPIVEVVKIAVNDAYKQNPSILNEFFGLISKIDGVTDIWSGPELQDDQYFYVVIQWSTKDPQLDFSKPKAALLKAAKEIVYVNDVRFSVPVEKALNSPVTELAVLTVKDTTDSAQFEKVGNELIQKIFEYLPDEVIAGGRGAIDGKPKQFIVCLGWYSLERFQSAFPKATEVMPTVIAVKGLADIDLRHAKLSKRN